MYVPWKQNVDLSVVVVVMADAKKALGVTMYCHAEQPRILHSLNLANVAVGKVSDYREFLVKKPGQNVTTEIAHDGESIVNPSEILSQTQKKIYKVSTRVDGAIRPGRVGHTCFNLS